MFFAVSESDRRRAKSGHELSMVNLLLFNLLIGIALLAGSMAQPDSFIGQYKWYGVAVPLAISLAIMGFTFVRAKRLDSTGPWFAAVHWSLSSLRYKAVLVAYLVCAAILSLALVTGKDEDAIAAQVRDLPRAMQEMERHKLQSQNMGEAVWARIAVVPLLLTIMVTIMLESGAIYQAQRGEVPDGMIERIPPPSSLQGSDREVLPPDH